MEPRVTEKIGNLVSQITNEIAAREIILFGSYAYGNPREDSDLDLCVITSNNSKRKTEIMRDIRKAIAPIASLPVDILVYNENEFYSRAQLNTTLEYKIMREGIKVYEQ
jgi:uncharacterized protein